MLVKEAYKHWAATYDTDRNLTRDLDAQVAERRLGSLRVRTILEVGCGTGKNTPLFASIGEQVTALDFSEAMIEQAKNKTWLDNVAFQVADITERWPVEERSVNLVTFNLVLEHVEDLDFVFGEASRVLANDGIVFVSELHPFRQYRGVVARFERDNQRIEIPAFVHHISDFLKAAGKYDLGLVELEENWHAEDAEKPPRLITFIFRKHAK